MLNDIEDQHSENGTGETFKSDQAIMLYVYIDHPLIKQKAIEKREYQVNISQTCIKNSTLVVLPTGMGKTIIALFVMAERLQSHGGKVLFMAPTKPLAVQHYNFLKDLLKVQNIALFTGEVAPAKRKSLWNDNRVIISTPQVIQNDIITGKINLRDVTLVIFDEAHKSVGNYAYVFIGEKYHEQAEAPLILGITASPGYDSKKILEICENLNIESVEIRSEIDPDVMPYVYDIDMKWIKVDIPPSVRRIAELMRGILNAKLRILRGFGLIRKGDRVSTKEILEAQRRIQGRIHNSAGKPPRSLFQAAIAQAAAMKINHAIELAETQGTKSLVNYLQRLEAEAGSHGSSKAARSLVKDPKFIKALAIASNLQSEHPKLAKSVEIVKNQLASKADSRIIVFTHYRETSDLVVETLNRTKNIRAVRFIGQASKNGDKGLRQKDQVKIIEQFKKGTYNVLVATSVAEEGLDIPSTDLVVFYEPIPSEIRTIQRRGRTGRRRAGKVVILITRQTRDEAYHWTSRSKEKRMKSELMMLREDLKKKLKVVGIPDPGPLEGTKTPVIGSDTIFKFDEVVSASPDEPDKDDRDLIRTAEMAEDEQNINNPEIALENEIDDDGIKLEISKPDERVNPSDVLGPIKPSGRNKVDSGETVGLNDIELGSTDIPFLDINQSNLGDFEPEGNENIRIITDTREFNSNVVKALVQNNVKVEPLQLGAGDYIISERVAVERKTTDDLIESIIDGRLFSQLKKLKGLYLNPILVIEGTNLFNEKNLPPNTLSGALASIVSDFRIPIFNTKNERETVKLLIALARRELSNEKRSSVAVRPDKGKFSFQEQQQFIIEGLPNISSVMARRLLVHFGTVGAIFNAPVEELCRVKGIGKKTAEEIQRVISEKYQ